MKRKSIAKAMILFFIAVLMSQSVLAALAPACALNGGAIDSELSIEAVSADDSAMPDMANCHDMSPKPSSSSLCDCLDCQCDCTSTYGQALSKFNALSDLSESSSTPISIGTYPTIVSLIELPPQ